jgi:hypothetical protein
MEDPSLEVQSLSLAEVMFAQGLALSGTFIFAAVFVAMAGMITYMRETEPERLANYSRLDAVFHSFMSGFSFGADVFLITSVWADSPALAMVMLAARLFHFFGGIILIASLFAPMDSVKKAGPFLDLFLKDAYRMRHLMDSEYASENSWAVESISLFSFCDLTMLQFLPWKKSKFYTMSEGYPSMRFMKASMTIKLCQTLISVICEISYLVLYSGSNSSSDSPKSATEAAQAEALFAMNIIFGVVVVIMDLVVIVVRGEVLSNLNNTETRVVRHPSSANGQQRKGESDGDNGDDGDNAGVMIEMDDVYAESGSSSARAGVDHSSGDASAAGAMEFTANPMYALSASAVDQQQQKGCGNKERDIAVLQSAISQLDSEKMQLRARDTQITAEKNLLQEKIARLKSGGGGDGGIIENSL